jgi:hypothetical protein
MEGKAALRHLKDPLLVQQNAYADQPDYLMQAKSCAPVLQGTSEVP